MARTTQDELTKRAEARNHLYGLLSCAYRREPTQEFLEGFKDKGLLQYLKHDTADELAVEYTRLFIGPGKHIYLCESTFLGERGGKISGEVKDLIEFYGLRYREDYNEAPDHLSVELEFMQHLTNGEKEAWKGGDSLKAAEFLKVEKKFVQDHLITWIPEFSDTVIKQANTSFYREIARLTKEYLVLESKEIDLLIKETEVMRDV